MMKRMIRPKDCTERFSSLWLAPLSAPENKGGGTDELHGRA